jgi:hypothetical protein
VLLQGLRSKAAKMISGRHRSLPPMAAAEVSKVMNKEDGETTVIERFTFLIT